MNEVADREEPQDGSEVSQDGVDAESSAEALDQEASDSDDNALADSGSLDQLGIPMSREPTLDDVRSDGQKHRAFAFGCSVAVAAAVLAFFLIRVLLLG